MLAALSLKICRAYSSNQGLVFGGKTYTASTIKLLVDNTDFIFFPLVNPDDGHTCNRQRVTRCGEKTVIRIPGFLVAVST